MTNLDRITCIAGPLFVAIVAAAQISGVTIEDFRTDAVLRWVASFGVFS